MSEQMKSGIELIADERSRQVAEEGWTPEHDDQHRGGDLARAAICYAESGRVASLGGSLKMILNHKTFAIWPWETSWWKPSPDPIRNLVKAGALIAAEIDRLQRREANGERG